MEAVAKKLGINVDEKQGALANLLVNGALGLSFVGMGLFGLWVLGCIVGGMIAAGGPLGFVSSWFSAVTGG